MRERRVGVGSTLLLSLKRKTAPEGKTKVSSASGAGVTSLRARDGCKI